MPRVFCKSFSLTAFDFAVPFEEDDRDQKIWFLDHSYLEGMFAMFRKVNGEDLLPTSLEYSLSQYSCT